MKALILNSGMGTRMGSLTVDQPKCMTEIGSGETILSRQLGLLHQVGVTEIVMTTGFLQDVLEEYCRSLDLKLKYTFVFNEQYRETNYIYSIYLAKEYLLGDVLMLHGDLVFERSILWELIKKPHSCMTVSSKIPLPPKDFKAVAKNDLIQKVGVEFFDNAVAAQPLYKLKWQDWSVWLNVIANYCEIGQLTCYAENALNEVTDRCKIRTLDFGNRLCTEVDNVDDLNYVKKELEKLLHVERE